MMAEPKFTPGKWIIESCSDGRTAIMAPCPLVAHPKSHTERVAILDDPNDGPIIAAAPDLYAALRAMVDADDAHWPLDCAERVRSEARAALARAEGRAE